MGAEFFSKYSSAELAHIWIVVCFSISPQNSEQRSVFGFNFYLEIPLLDVAHKGYWVAAETNKNIKQVSLKLWPSVKDIV